MRRRIPRDFWWRRTCLALGVCLPLVAAPPTLPHAWPDDDLPSLRFPAHDPALAVLAADPNVGIQKQALSNRVSAHKPQRAARLSTAQKAFRPHPRPRNRYAFHNLPRRSLTPGRITARSPDDPSHSFLP